MNVLDWDPDGFILGQDGFSPKIEITETSCVYFCPHFYKKFKERTNIKDASVFENYKMKEALCYCLSCNDKNKKRLKIYDTSSDRYFLEARKLLMLYYPKNN